MHYTFVAQNLFSESTLQNSFTHNTQQFNIIFRMYESEVKIYSHT